MGQQQLDYPGVSAPAGDHQGRGVAGGVPRVSRGQYAQTAQQQCVFRVTYICSRQVNILILNGHEEKQTLLQIVFLDSPKSENYITQDTNKDIDVNRSRQADISKLQILHLSTWS